jgi:chemotaxis response regulator CheB
MSLKTILESDNQIEVVGCGHDGSDAIALYERDKPDLVFMDIQMKNVSGLEAAEQIMKKDPAAKILFLMDLKSITMYMQQILHLVLGTTI